MGHVRRIVDRDMLLLKCGKSERPLGRQAYSKTPLIRINWDGEPSGYLYFSLKIGYTGSLKFACYYLQFVPASKPIDHA